MPGAVPARPGAPALLAGAGAAGYRGAPPPRSGVLDYASVALVGLALPPGTPLPELSGFLVPPSEGTLVKAATFFTRKWAQPGRRPARSSCGPRSAGPARRAVCSSTTRSCSELAHAELGQLLGATLPPPVAAAWCSGGAAACRSTRRAISTGWRAPGPRCRRGLALAGAALRRGRHPGLRRGQGETAADRVS